MKTEVSKITRLLTRTFEAQLSGVLRHEVFELLQRYDLLQRSMDSLGSGLDAEHLCSLVGQFRIQSNGREDNRHIYNISQLYICARRMCFVFGRLLIGNGYCS